MQTLNGGGAAHLQAHTNRAWQVCVGGQHSNSTQGQEDTGWLTLSTAGSPCWLTPGACGMVTFRQDNLVGDAGSYAKSLCGVVEKVQESPTQQGPA